MESINRNIQKVASDNVSFEWLIQQLGQVLKRVEHCEGKLAQLQASSIRPGLLFPNRREFQRLEERVQKLEEGA